MYFTFIDFRGGQLRKPGGGIDLKPGEGEKMYKLKSELTDLERDERVLDTHIKWLKQCATNLAEESDNYRYSYLTLNDITTAYPENQSFVIHAPKGSKIVVSFFDIKKKLKRITVHILDANSISSRFTT